MTIKTSQVAAAASLAVTASITANGQLFAFDSAYAFALVTSTTNITAANSGSDAPFATYPAGTNVVPLVAGRVWLSSTHVTTVTVTPASDQRYAPSNVGSLYNPQGLQRWYISLTKVAPGQGGVDVVLMACDSHVEGAKTAVYSTGRFSYQLTNQLQAKYNPIGVPGGYGYYPAVTGTGNATWSAVGTAGTNGLDGMVPEAFNESAQWGLSRVVSATGLRYLSTSQSGLRLRWDLPGYATRKLGATDYEVVGPTATISSTHKLDHSTTTGAFLTASGADGTINANTGSLQFGGLRTKISGLTAANPLCVQIAQSAGQAFNEGIILYNGDYGAGVRVHNLACFGTNVGQWAADTQSLSSNIDVWASEPPSTTTAVGARRASLFILECITNDFAGAVDLATFTAKYQTIVARIVAQPSRPCVLFLVPPIRNNGNAATYTSYINAMKSIVDANPTTCALYSLWDDFSQDAYGGMPTTQGIAIAGDGVHFTDGLHSLAAAQLARCL